MTVVHSKGYSADYPMSEWYSNLKAFLMEKMNNYQQLREFMHQNKNF